CDLYCWCAARVALEYSRPDATIGERFNEQYTPQEFHADKSLPRFRMRGSVRFGRIKRRQSREIPKKFSNVRDGKETRPHCDLALFACNAFIGTVALGACHGAPSGACFRWRCCPRFLGGCHPRRQDRGRWAGCKRERSAGCTLHRPTEYDAASWSY